MVDTYYRDHYSNSIWRERGDQPLLHRTRIRELRRATPGRRMLEIGSGEGHFAVRAARSGFEVLATDLRQAGASATRRRARTAGVDARVHSVVASAEALPTRSASFDAVVAWDVLEHVPDALSAIKEISRVLVPNGVLALTTPNPHALSVRRRGQESHVFRDETHIGVRTSDEWRRLITANNLNVEHAGYDSWWDAPYFGVPRLKIAWSALAQCMLALRTTWPFASAENVVILAKRV